VPHPFTSREEYEQAMRMPLGGEDCNSSKSLTFDYFKVLCSCDVEEWNASHVVKENTRPAVLTRAGRLIEPIKLPKKRPAPDSLKSNLSNLPMKNAKKIKIT